MLSTDDVKYTFNFFNYYS